MDRESLAARIDHTALGPTTTRADAERVVTEAREHGMNACVPPCYVGDVAPAAGDTTLVTVVDFPHGQAAPADKVAASEAAWVAGADELDVVLNRGRLLGGEDEAVRAEIERVVAAVPVPVKVIVEAAALEADPLRRAAELARDAGADYLKTSSGFDDAGGAAVADVELLAEYLPVKASGGIADYETATAMLDAGAERIGASAGVAILAGAPAPE